MVSEKILSALKIVYDRLCNQNVFWIASGSTSLAIQGVDVSIGDIDILTNLNDIYRIDELLADFRVEKPNYSSTEKYRSCHGVYQVNDVKVEIMGDFQYLRQDGAWSGTGYLQQGFVKEFQDMKLLLLPLEVAIQEYQHLGRTDKVEKIKEAQDKIWNYK